MIEVFLGDDRQWYWRVKARNGRIVAQSEGYTTKGNAQTGVKALCRALDADLDYIEVKVVGA